jgi:outer membrane protein
MRFRIPVLVLAAVTAAAALWAGDLTLAQARELAVGRSSVVARALLGVDAARLTERTRYYDLLPSLSVRVGAGLDYPGQTGTQVIGSAGVSVSQTLYDGGKTRAQAALDAIDTSKAREEARAAWLAIVQEVDAAYYSVLQARAGVDGARSDLDASALHLALATAQLEVGTITRTEHLKAQSERAAKETALSQVRRSLSIAVGKLASLTGLTAPLDLAGVAEEGTDALATRVSALDDAAALRLIAALQAAASSGNPSLAAAALARDRAAGEVKLAGRDALPTIGAAWTHAIQSDASGNQEQGSGSVTLTASLPLDLWATTSAVDARKIAARQADFDVAEERTSVELSIEQAVYDGIAASRALASSARALEYARSAYEGVLEQYRLSRASSSDLSDAEALVSTSRASLIAARYGFLTTLSTLRSLAGLDDDALLAGMIP